MQNLSITAAIPTYKRPRQFHRALDSVLEQTLQPDQIIVGDDGEDEEVRDICLSYKDDRIVYVPRRSRKRMTENWNFVMRWARQGLVALLEDDNIWLPDHLSRAKQLFLRFPEAGIYHAGHQEAWDRGGHLEIYRKYFPPWHERLSLNGGGSVPREDIVLDALLCGSINSSTVVVHREIIEKIPPFDHRYLMGMDTLMWTRIAMVSPCIYGSNYDAIYTYHGNNVSVGEVASRRAGAQARASRRLIVSEALARGIISPTGIRQWLLDLSPNAASSVMTLLAHRTVPCELRRIVKEVWRARWTVRSSGYLRASRILGFEVLSHADRIDVILGVLSKFRIRKFA